MKTILLIEDNLEIRENTSELLELDGYTVITAANGLIGYELALKENPDVILCDIMMPEMDGYKVFERLKANPVTEQVPFIFITASAEKSQVEKGIGMGAAGYISKPFTEEELLFTVGKYFSEGG